jgi:hypothetical protein
LIRPEHRHQHRLPSGAPAIDVRIRRVHHWLHGQTRLAWHWRMPFLPIMLRPGLTQGLGCALALVRRVRRACSVIVSWLVAPL